MEPAAPKCFNLRWAVRLGDLGQVTDDKTNMLLRARDKGRCLPFTRRVAANSALARLQCFRLLAAVKDCRKQRSRPLDGILSDLHLYWIADLRETALQMHEA